MVDNPRQIDSSEGAYSPQQQQPSMAYNTPHYPNVATQASHSGGASYGQQQAYRGGDPSKSPMHESATNESNTQPDIEFKPSPFYRIQKQIDIKVCDSKAPRSNIRHNLTDSQGMDSHRHQVQLNVKTAEHPELHNLDSNTRVMVFCATGSGLGRQDIAFPHPSELKVNGVDIKGNLRGLKNKPGTTRPVDITDMLRLKLPKYSNVVEFVYALTKEACSSQVRFQITLCRRDSLSTLILLFFRLSFLICSNADLNYLQKHYIIINLVKMIPVDDLVKSLSVGTKITKSSVVNESKLVNSLSIGMKADLLVSDQ